MAKSFTRWRTQTMWIFIDISLTPFCFSSFSHADVNILLWAHFVWVFHLNHSSWHIVEERAAAAASQLKLDLIFALQMRNYNQMYGCFHIHLYHTWRSPHSRSLNIASCLQSKRNWVSERTRSHFSTFSVWSLLIQVSLIQICDHWLGCLCNWASAR